MSGVEKSQLLRAAEEHIRSLGVTIWGQSFEVCSTEGREEAALWLVRQIRAVVGHLRPIMEPEQMELLIELERQLSGLKIPVREIDTTEYRAAADVRRTAPVTGWTGPPVPPPSPVDGEWVRPGGW